MFEESELSQLRQVVREELRSVVLEMGAASPPPGPRRELVSITQAAATAGVSERTMSAWLREGKVQRHGEGRTSRIDRDELLRVLTTPKAVPPERMTADEWASGALKKRKQKQEE